MPTERDTQRVLSGFAELTALCDYYMASRGIGHTEALIQGAQRSRAIVLAADAQHARLLRQQGLNTEPRFSLVNGRLRGSQSALLVDHWALQQMVADARDIVATETRHVLTAVWLAHQGAMEEWAQLVARTRAQHQRDLVATLAVWTHVVALVAVALRIRVPGRAPAWSAIALLSLLTRR